MAKIEMDISEYEIMKENKKMLEQSLEKERELQKEIKRLNEEKIKALEDAKMKVVKITKTETREHLLRKKTISTNVLRQLGYILGVTDRMFEDRFLRQNLDEIHMEHLISIFFDKISSFSMPIEEITTVGLDEVKVEIREQLKSEMDSEIKLKIENAEKVLSLNNDLIKENKKLASDYTSIQEINIALVGTCDSLKKELNSIHNNENKIKEINTLLKEEYSFWNKSKFINKIISIIKE